MTPQNYDFFWFKVLCYGIGMIILLIVFPVTVFAGTPSDASREPDQAYEDAYRDAYQDIYDTLMEDFDVYQLVTDSSDLASMELYSVVLECRDSLDECFYLLVLGDVFLAVLIGCVCAFILSIFLRLPK